MTPEPLPAPEGLTLTDFRALAGRRLHAAPPSSPALAKDTPHRPSDFDLNPGAYDEMAPVEPPKPAAVLIPVVARRELSLLFTQRTEHLPAHAGQIAFPGGKIDTADDGPVAAALREAEEEIGLDRRQVEVLGFLDNYLTGSGYRITPVVGILDPAFSLILNVEEVSDAFEVPLAFLMNPAHHHEHTRTFRGRERLYYAMPYGERYIWGVTAGILKNMHERLFQR